MASAMAARPGMYSTFALRSTQKITATTSRISSISVLLSNFFICSIPPMLHYLI